MCIRDRAYTAHEYPHEEGVAVDGVTVAASIGEDPACVYKTLVTQGICFFICFCYPDFSFCRSIRISN